MKQHFWKIKKLSMLSFSDSIRHFSLSAFLFSPVDIQQQFCKRNVWNIQMDLIGALVDLNICCYDQRLYKVENSFFINFFRVSRFPIFSAISNAIYFWSEQYIRISYITLLFRINWSVAYSNFSSFEVSFVEHSWR